MDKGQEPSVVERLFNAIDDKDYSTARFALSEALDEAGRNGPLAAPQTPRNTPFEGQA